MTQVILANLIQNTYVEAARSPGAEEPLKNKRKKVIHFLKEEMTNIRQGMNKLIRAKSQQNIKFQLKSSNQQDIGAKSRKKQHISDSSSPNFSVECEVKLLRQRVKYLQSKNMSLEAELRQRNIIELKRNDEKAALLHSKMCLEMQNEALRKHIKGLAEHISKLNTQNQIEVVNLPNFGGIPMNPENEPLNKIKQKSPWQSYERLRRQYNQLVTILNRLEADNHLKQILVLQRQKMIEGLNGELMRVGIKQINSKYQSVIGQQQQFS